MLFKVLNFCNFFFSYVFWTSLGYFVFGADNGTIWCVLLNILWVFGRIVNKEIPAERFESAMGGLTGFVFTALIAALFIKRDLDGTPYPDIPIWVVLLLLVVSGSYRFLDRWYLRKKYVLF
jgi:drug/metabolite transporter (DMT)-like permease